MSANPKSVNRAFVPWVLYGALWMSTGAYILVLVLQNDVLDDLEPDPIMLPALAIVAVITAVVSRLLPWHLHRTALHAAELEVEEVPDPDGSVMFRDKSPTIRVFADAEAAERRAYAIFFTPFILRMALAESVAIYGFVLRMMGFDWAMIAPFFVGCWILFAFTAPTEARVLGPLEEAFDARFPDAPPQL